MPPVQGPAYNPQSVGNGGVGVAGAGAPNISLTAPTAPIAPGQPGGDQSQLGLIDQEYQNYMQSLGGYEGNINNQFGQSTALLGSQNSEALGQLNTQEQNQTQGVKADQQGAQLQAANQQQQQESVLRQLLGDLQQRNSAKQSQFGNSSVTDATNEAYGRQALKGVAGIQQQRSEADQQIETQTRKQISGLQDFYNQNRMKLTQGYQTALQDLTAQRDQKLAAIGEARNQAATTKAQQSFSAWQEYLSAKRQVDLQTFQSAQALQQYAAKKQADLANQYQTAKITVNQTTDPLTGIQSTNRSVSQTVPAANLDYYMGSGGATGEQSLQVGNDPLEDL